ncbi:MAG: biopolymer transporter ExbD [Oligoflexales bacterium]|nr:biopolymer transporter ExbD [Oligoflexales bacterium]
MAFNLKGSGNGDEYEGMAEINIIPLVDVMLVLLIVFMVAAPLSVTGIKIDLPQSKAKGAAIESKRVVLSINKQGDYYLSQQKVPADALKERLRVLFEGQENKTLYIRADRGVVYGSVVDAMGQAKMAGVDKISMITKPQSSS